MIENARRDAWGRVAGMALAGGRSSRFGSEKAVALLRGVPLLTRVVATLRECCEEVAVSSAAQGRSAELAGSLHLPLLTDRPEHPRGPLAGLAAGLAWAQAGGFDCLITLPCDTPLVGKAELSDLLIGLRDHPAAYAVTDRGPHPLCAVWRTDVIGNLDARLTLGEHPAVRDWLDEVGAIGIRFRDQGQFRNANTPQELAALEVASSSLPTENAELAQGGQEIDVVMAVARELDQGEPL